MQQWGNVCALALTLTLTLTLTQVQEYLTVQQWGNVCALKEIEFFKPLSDELELNVEAWREWVELPNPEEEDLPGEWHKKTSGFQKVRPPHS